MDTGHGSRREDVMYNDFVIVGPPEDPAGIEGMADGAAAFSAIAAAEAPFVSRGDDSGTHTKEKAIWEAAGIEPAGDWYISAGQGMGAVLTMSNDLQAYTLTDRGTYLSMKDKLDLEIVVEGDPELFNPYGIMAVNPAKHSHANYMGAMAYIAWITSVEGQRIIGEYTRNGQVLFYPDAIVRR